MERFCEKYLAMERVYQSGINEGKPLHKNAIIVMYLLFGLNQNNYHDVVAEKLSDLLYMRDTKGN